jgi:serine carboxypeptidase-like clade 2
VADNYVSFANASIWIYPILMRAGLRVWVYSGDVDADVPITGTMSWRTSFKEEQRLAVIEPWREWWVKGLHRHEDQVGGMVWELTNLTFVSVRGAGHLVPKDKPK